MAVAASVTILGLAAGFRLAAAQLPGSMQVCHPIIPGHNA